MTRVARAGLVSALVVSFLSIDVGAVLARPGIHAVITAAEIGEVPIIPMRQESLPAFKPYLQPVIARDKVRLAPYLHFPMKT